MTPDLSHESVRPGPVCGVDEAGRGPWAGPVVAAAVILDPARVPPGLNDSKKLSAPVRARLAVEIAQTSIVSVAQASVAEIDAMGVGRATDLAMRRAVAGLVDRPVFALIDGLHVPQGLPCRAEALVGGDGRAASIAAASILAKTARDATMVALSQQFPGYGWQSNKGYGVKAHREALIRLGGTPHHRRSFKPVHKILIEENYISP